MAAARDLGFRLGMVTNGLTLTADKAERLAGLGMESIVVSLDGPEEIHDWLRDRPGSFRHASGAIRALRTTNMRIVEAITCVTPRGLARLDETYEIVRDLGATHWRVFNIFPNGRARDNGQVLLGEDGIRELIERIAGLRKRGADEGLVVNLSEEGHLGWDWDDQVRDAPYFCRAGINIAGIMVDGAIAACPNLPPWMNQGNLADDDFVQVWEERYELFRDRSWTKEGSCGECPEWDVCRGNSLHLWDQEAKEPCWCHHRILHPQEGGA
jgi:radical SAM protein with 4Fe4S-binding SPASM domain